MGFAAKFALTSTDLPPPAILAFPILRTRSLPCPSPDRIAGFAVERRPEIEFAEESKAFVADACGDDAEPRRQLENLAVVQL